MAALDRTIGEIRAFITDPEASAQPGELAQRLAELVEEYRGGSVPIELTIQDRPPRPLDAETARQLAREALANAVQHSGAGRIEVALRFHADRVGLTVRDDGRGFRLQDADAAQAGRG